MVARSKTRRWKRESYTRLTILDLKREYAETFYDKWVIVSAEHGFIPPWREIEPYDTHIDDWDDDEFSDFLAFEPLRSVRSAVIGLERADEIDVLAGKKYCKAVKEACRKNDYEWQQLDARQETTADKLAFPFQEADLAGIGEQIGWLKTALEEHLRRPGDNYKGQVGLDRYSDTVV